MKPNFRKRSNAVVISVSMPLKYVKAIDALVNKKIYYSRSDLVRDALRNFFISKFPDLLGKQEKNLSRRVNNGDP